MCSIQIMPVPFAHKIYTSISKIYKVLLPFQMSICFCSYIFLLLHKLVTSVISFGTEFLFWNSAPNRNTTFWNTNLVMSVQCLSPLVFLTAFKNLLRQEDEKKKKNPRQTLCTKSSNFIHTAIHMLKGTFTRNKIGMTPLETGNTTTLTRKISDLLPYKRSKCPRENPQAWLWRGKHMKFEIG